VTFQKLQPSLVLLRASSIVVGHEARFLTEYEISTHFVDPLLALVKSDTVADHASSDRSFAVTPPDVSEFVTSEVYAHTVYVAGVLVK
jgi:hypothetical protein